MRVSAPSDMDVLTHTGTRLHALLPGLEPLTTALMRRQQRSLVLAGTCPRQPLSALLRLVWHRPRPPHLQVVFARHSGAEWQGVGDAGMRGDLRDAKRRRALLTQHTTTCIIDINWPLTVSPEVASRVVARGPTKYVPSGQPAVFQAAILGEFRRQDMQRLAAWKARRRPQPAYGHRTLSLSPVLTKEEIIFGLGLVLAQEGLIAATAVQSMLITHFGIPASAVEPVWQGLHQHFTHPQHPLGLRAYITRCRDAPPRRSRRSGIGRRRRNTGPCPALRRSWESTRRPSTGGL
jgi:hypothetical protein